MYRNKGFTLIELMVAVAVVGILAAIALPSYNQYILRSRIPEGLNALASYAARMEQRYQDTNNYGAAACGVPVGVQGRFTLTCQVTNGGQGFTAQATGDAAVGGATFTIDHNGVRRTTAHPNGVPPQNCWSTRGTTCDS